MANVIAIDGPSGAGKSSVSRIVGRRLGYLHVDSGALYRIMTWQCLVHGVDMESPEAIHAFTATVEIECRPEDGRIAYYVGGESPGERIRTPEINANASKVAREKPVPNPFLDAFLGKLRQRQQRFAGDLELRKRP